MHLMQQAIEFLREPLLWDGEHMEITNLTEANQGVGRSYRDGWEVEAGFPILLGRIAPKNA